MSRAKRETRKSDNVRFFVVVFFVTTATYHPLRSSRPSRSTDVELEDDRPSSSPPPPRELGGYGGGGGRDEYREMRDLRCDYRDPPHRDYHDNYRDRERDWDANEWDDRPAAGGAAGGGGGGAGRRARNVSVYDDRRNPI